MAELFEEFYAGLKSAGGALPSEFFTRERAERLYIHVCELSEKGRAFNLTAITDPAEVINKHIIDCLFAAAKVRELAGCASCSLIDVGSGGGFPSLPIACVLDNVHVTALDATAKKCGFIAGTAERCGVKMDVITGRAEELSHGELRESFDFATARAVAPLNVLAELCLPFIKVGGYFTAMKGAGASEEAVAAERAVARLGAVSDGGVSYEIEDGGVRQLLIYRKISPTPPSYPRMYSKIKKSPL